MIEGLVVIEDSRSKSSEKSCVVWLLSAMLWNVGDVLFNVHLGESLSGMFERFHFWWLKPCGGKESFIIKAVVVVGLIIPFFLLGPSSFKKLFCCYYWTIMYTQNTLSCRFTPRCIVTKGTYPWNQLSIKKENINSIPKTPCRSLAPHPPPL